MIRGLRWSLRFALAEIRHEWLFALGVAFAVCSVITTTSLLWGTRSGMIASLRERLMQDPTTRELSAVENVSQPLEWFSELREDPRVDFLIPSVGRISLDGPVSTISQPRRSVDAAFVPTALGDPLGGGFPYDSKAGQPVPTVISAIVAEELGVGKGALLRIDVTRNDTTGIIRAPLDVRVFQVLEMHQTRRHMILMPLQVLEMIEAFKVGWPVPSLGWPGSTDVDLPVFVDAVTLDVGEAQPLNGLLANASRNGYTATSVDGNQSMLSKVRLEMGAEGTKMSSLKKLFDTSGIQHGTVIPHTVSTASLQGVTVQILTDGAAIKLEHFFALSPRINPPGIKNTAVEIKNPQGAISRLAIPITRSGNTVDEWIAPSSLAPVLGAAKFYAITYDHSTGDMLPAHEQYPGFRLYAKHLEDVADLRRELANQGIQVRTNEDRITPILTLDAALGKFLAFIISAGALGGCGALFASIHLSVERSRRSFAALQLMGIPPFYMIASSIFQSILTVCVGTFFAFLLFQAGSKLLDTVFAGSGDMNSRICVLTLGQWSTLLGVALIFAVIATFPALLKARCKDPAVIARSE